ncbi:hypothetical protein [Micromonospora sp. NPDC004704]
MPYEKQTARRTIELARREIGNLGRREPSIRKSWEDNWRPWAAGTARWSLFAESTKGTNKMGIFSKKKSAATGAGEIGTFTSPHSLADTLVVVYGGVASQLSVAEREIQAPGLAASIYLSRLDTTGLTVTAGNKIETYFQFRVDLEAQGNGCKGHATFDRPMSDINRWMGNAIKLTFGLRSALTECSVQVENWRTG